MRSKKDQAMLLCLVTCLLLHLHSEALETYPPSCPSEIYCKGELLHDVQMSNLYPDSKTFVDLRLKEAPEEVSNAYSEFKKEKGGPLSVDDIKSFVDKYFMEGDELEVWSPPDWTPNPPIASKVKDPVLRNWTLQLNSLWKTLGRKIKVDVKDRPQQYSLIYVPNGFIVPGGRFKELYYWDTYWIVEGLMLCGMHQTAQGMVSNLLHLVDALGHVPNGNRVYYRERSQPPLLIPMFDKLDVSREFLLDSYKALKKEVEWWLDNRMVEVKINRIKYHMFRYYAPSEGPRPESYREDFATASSCSDEVCRTKKYIALKSGAESGWDFSSRWFRKNGSNNGTLEDTDPGHIIPVDLNAFMYENLGKLSQYAFEAYDSDYLKYSALQKKLGESMTSLLYDKEQGTWFDYDFKRRKPRKNFYLSNFAPLWTNSYGKYHFPNITKKVLKYIASLGLQNYPGGSPSSLVESGQQWDLPNAWPPLQAILIEGLDQLNSPQASELARELAQTWVRSNYMAFANSSRMYEKYDSNVAGRAGGGGEYDVQAGFGWTNGVILKFLNRWPDLTLS